MSCALLAAMRTYISVNVVGIDGVAAFVGSILDALRHNVADILAAQLQPPFAGPTVQFLA
jgi:hypothetical protein